MSLPGWPGEWFLDTLKSVRRNRIPALWVGLVLALGLAGGALVWFYPRARPEGGLLSDEVLPVPPAPPRLGGGADYDKCLDMIETDPEGALEFARTLPGDAGLHCQALAQVELGSPDLGAPILMQVGMDTAEDPAARAAILGQASQAFLMIDETVQARAASEGAVALLPDDPDVRFDDAIAAIQVKDLEGAIADLAVTLAADPKRGEALVARATAYREEGRLDLAAADADAAVALDGVDQDALLERGIIRQRRGDLAGARADWARVQDIDPDSGSADLATQNLELLDASGV